MHDRKRHSKEWTTGQWWFFLLENSSSPLQFEGEVSGDVGSRRTFNSTVWYEIVAFWGPDSVIHLGVA